MKGMTLTFTKQVQQIVAGVPQVDAFNNPVLTTTTVSVADCLVAPITYPENLREQQAMEQARDQVRLHLPKSSSADISDSTFTYDGKTFKVDSDSISFMNDNTPTRWNRYTRAEAWQN